MTSVICTRIATAIGTSTTESRFLHFRPGLRRWWVIAFWIPLLCVEWKSCILVQWSRITRFWLTKLLPPALEVTRVMRKLLPAFSIFENHSNHHRGWDMTRCRSGKITFWKSCIRPPKANHHLLPIWSTHPVARLKVPSKPCSAINTSCSLITRSFRQSKNQFVSYVTSSISCIKPFLYKRG